MAVSLSSINAKLKDFASSPEGKKRIEGVIGKYKESGVGKTAAGSEILTEDKFVEVAQEFTRILTKKALSHAKASPFDDGIPGSVLNHFHSLYIEGPFEEPDGSRSILVKFSDDLSRESLDSGDVGSDGWRRTGDGIDNIVALFNNGYNASKYVYGWWEGHAPIGKESPYRSGFDAKDAWIRSKKDREGLHFVQEAIDEFEAKYQKKYGITVSPGPYTG